MRGLAKRATALSFVIAVSAAPAAGGSVPSLRAHRHASCDDADLAAFDGVLSVVAITASKRFNLTHLSVKSVRIMSCFILASVLTTKNGTVDTTAEGSTSPLLLLDARPQLAQALNALEGASDASAKCPSITKSIKIVAVTRSRGTYTAHLKGTTSTPKKTAVAISCRRQGVGMQLTN